MRNAEAVAGTPRYLFRPLRPDQAAALYTRIERFGLFQNAAAYLDPYTGKVVRVEEERKDTPGGKAIIAIRTLHYGTVGGWVTQTLYTIAGLLPLGLFVTGLLKWVEQHRSRMQNRARGTASALRAGEEAREAAGAA